MNGVSRRAWIGLGANLGDPVATLRSALQGLVREPGCELVRSSSLYRSAPVDAEGPDFLNACAELRTTLSPAELLTALQRIESGHGRERPYPNAPRTLDLDLLLVDDLVLSTPSLVLPHPRLHERAFVLRPLAEIAPGLQVPGHGPLAPLLAATAQQDVERWGPLT